MAIKIPRRVRVTGPEYWVRTAASLVAFALVGFSAAMMIEQYSAYLYLPCGMLGWFVIWNLAIHVNPGSQVVDMEQPFQVWLKGHHHATMRVTQIDRRIHGQTNLEATDLSHFIEKYTAPGEPTP